MLSRIVRWGLVAVLMLSCGAGASAQSAASQVFIQDFEPCLIYLHLTVAINGPIVGTLESVCPNIPYDVDIGKPTIQNFIGRVAENGMVLEIPVAGAPKEIWHGSYRDGMLVFDYPSSSVYEHERRFFPSSPYQLNQRIDSLRAKVAEAHRKAVVIEEHNKRVAELQSSVDDARSSLTRAEEKYKASVTRLNVARVIEDAAKHELVNAQGKLQALSAMRDADRAHWWWWIYALVHADLAAGLDQSINDARLTVGARRGDVSIAQMQLEGAIRDQREQLLQRGRAKRELTKAEVALHSI